MRFFLTLLALVIFGSASSMAANPETFTVQMTIRQAITIANTAPLEFGIVDVGAGLQTVAAAASGHTAGAGAAAATFDIVGANGSTADISFVNPTVLVDDGGGNDLTVTLLLAGGATDTLAFDGTTQVIFVGGTVTVGGAAVPGSYTNTVDAQLQMVYQ